MLISYIIVIVEVKTVKTVKTFLLLIWRKKTITRIMTMRLGIRGPKTQDSEKHEDEQAHRMWKF